MTRRAVISVHDVAPGTLDRARRILDVLERAGAPPATLLVVPGREWSPRALDVLRGLARAGHPLAGHGWSHRAPRPATLHHRLHALVLSRDQAEHLSRPAEELREIVGRCHAWFRDRDLPVSELYVPPAWALGSLSPSDLRSLPFRWYETLTGFVDAASGRLRRLPLVGFEADTRARKWALRLWNGLNLGLARLSGRAVRIGLHPRDLELLLADEVERLARGEWNFVRVSDVMMDGAERPPAGGESAPANASSQRTPAEGRA